MARMKKLALAALMALALAAGGFAVGGETAQIAGSKGGLADPARESSIAWAAPDQRQIAGSKGADSAAGRESASLPTTLGELEQVAGSKGDMASAGRESS
jgi:hypothetical protein